MASEFRLITVLALCALASPLQAYVFPGEYRFSVILDDGRYRFPAHYQLQVSHDQSLFGKVDYSVIGCSAQLPPQAIVDSAVVLQERVVGQRPICAPREVRLNFSHAATLPAHADYLRLTPGAGEQLRAMDAYRFTPTGASRFLLAQQLGSPSELSADRPLQALEYLALQLQPEATEHDLVDQLFPQALGIPPPDWSMRLLVPYAAHPLHARLTSNWLAELAKQPWQAQPDPRQQTLFNHLAVAGIPQSELEKWQLALLTEQRQRLLQDNDRRQLEAFVAANPEDAEAQATLLANYRAENSFAGFMAAFRLQGDTGDIRRAMQQAGTPGELAEAERVLIELVPFDRLFSLQLSERHDSPLRAANQSALMHSMTAQVKDIERRVQLTLRADSPLPLQQVALRIQIDFIERFEYSPPINGPDKDVIQQTLMFHLHPGNAWSDEHMLIFNAVPVHGTYRPGGVGALNMLGNLLGGAGVGCRCL